MKDYETPASTGYRVIRCQTEEEKLTESDQTLFRSGVGSLLYLLKHSRPDLSNCIRELTKVMDAANKAHLKALYRVVKYVKQTQSMQLQMQPMTAHGKWTLEAFSDSDFAGDTDTRRSISGFIIYFCGCPVAWRSRGQKNVTLSSTEAEYVAVSEVTQEIMHIVGVLKFLKVEIQFPITVNVDNIGAIYLSQTAMTGNRTKHIDTRYHFV
jgi:hypothetical protein